LTKVDGDKVLAVRTEEGDEEFVGEMVDVFVESEVFANVFPDWSLMREFFDSVLVIGSSIVGSNVGNVEGVFEAEEIWVGERRSLGEISVEGSCGISEPRSLISFVEKFNVGESDRVLNRRDYSVLFGVRPESRFDVVTLEWFLLPFVSRSPTTESFFLSSNRIDELDVVPADNRCVRIVGERFHIEEFVEWSISSFGMNSG